MHKLTVLIPALNEERNLPDCLQSVMWADEILLIDSFSTDKTLEIATSFQAKILQHEYKNHASQINWGIEQAKNEWILYLDADERATPELHQEIQALLSQEPACKAYQLARRNFYFGKEVRHGGFGNDWLIRLFHRDHGRMDDDGNHTHGNIRVNSTTQKLQGRIIHHTCNTLDEYFRTIQRYTTGSAFFYYQRQKKATWLDLLGRPLWSFFQRYFLRVGFLDGLHGLNVCILYSYYTFLKYFKLWYLYNINDKLE
jgi:glycosyltransferase involved in cell wall biosynthesis